MLTTAQLTSLQSELTNDPLSLGYAALIVSGSDAGIVAILNAVTGNGTASIFNNQVPTSAFVRSIVAADFAALTAVQISQLNLLFTGGFLDVTNANTVTLVTNFVSSMSSATKTAVAAIAKRTGSRAEVLFGVGTVIQSADVSMALRGH